MLGDITQAKNVYNVCGRTDMRKGIRGLTALVQQNYQMDPPLAAHRPFPLLGLSPR